jgi:hypothetical protein
MAIEADVNRVGMSEFVVAEAIKRAVRKRTVWASCRQRKTLQKARKRILA